MGKISVFNSVTLDGVMQAPARQDEDTRGGFPYGGWALPYNDQVIGNYAARGMAKRGALLFGRRTYEDFYSIWPNRTEPNPFTEVLNNTLKYVASNTLSEPLPWVNSTLLSGNAADRVARLKQESQDDLMILGSGVLIQSLLKADLIDAITLLIHPLVLGMGRRMFEQDGVQARFRLVDTQPSTTGVIIATYERNR